MAFSQALLFCKAVCGVGAAMCLLCLFVRVLRKGFRWVAGSTVLVAATLLYYPITAQVYGMEHWFKTLSMAVYASARLFVIDGDFMAVRIALQDVSATVRFFRGSISYETAMLLLYILAPATTVTVIAAFFRETVAWLRLHLGRPLTGWYVFSELSSRSLALAEDICKTHKAFRTIVFHDVYRKNSEPDAELLERAERLRAVCFKKDVTRLRRWLPLWKTEFFMIGENESENLDQAVRVTERFRNRGNTAVYVWARSPESKCILDSVQKTSKESKKNAVTGKMAFKLRRIDDVEQFAWKTLYEADLFSKMTTWGGKNLISVLIIGMGDYGDAFLKTAAWMYQRDDVCLEINVIDARDNVTAQLQHRYPELMRMNDCTVDGEAHYSIRVLENINVFEGGLEQIVFGNGDAELRGRLRRTTAAFVTLGDDDINVRAALELRQLFDCICLNEYIKEAEEENKKKLALAQYFEKAGRADECKHLKDAVWKLYKSVGKSAEKNRNDREKDGKIVEIYTPVYDERKIGNIMLEGSGENEAQLHCYDGTPYHIYFKGSFRAQYTYDAVVRTRLERAALVYHLQWSGIEDITGIRNYDRYEYYRHSSMAKALHKNMLKPLKLECTAPKKEDRPKEKRKRIKRHLRPDQKNISLLKQQEDCECQACERSKKIEHMRWNAYMRTLGYSRPDAKMQYQIKLSRSKLHWELVGYHDLSAREQRKDSTVDIS